MAENTVPVAEPAPQARSPRLPRTVWLLCWVSFLADVSSEMLYPLLPLFVVGILGASRTALGTMEGLAAVTVALLTLWAGARSDVTGRRVGFIRLGYLLPVLGKTLVALAWAWPVAFLGRIMDRTGKGLRISPRDALLADAVDTHRRGEAFGLHRSMDTAGALVGVLLSALGLFLLTGTSHGGSDADSAHEFAFRVLIGAGAAVGLGSALLTFLVRDTPPNVRHSAASGADPDPGAGSGSGSGIAGRRGLTAWQRLPAPGRRLILVLGLFALANSSDAFLLLRASDLGFGALAVVLVYAVYNTTYALLSWPIGRFSDRVGRARLLAAGWALYGLVYATLAFLSASCAWLLWPTMALYGVYMALTEGVGKALIADRTPPALRGTAMGFTHALTGTGVLLAGLITGALWDLIGPRAAFLLAATLALLALALLPWAVREPGDA